MRVDARRESGSALVLIPVLMLIIIVAAGLVIDSAIGFTAKRALVDTAATAANDAANGLDSDSLFTSGSVKLNEDLVTRIASKSVATRSDGVSDVTLVSSQVIDRNGRPAVEVTVSGSAKKVFGIFGDKRWQLRATAVSMTRQDD
jgi:Flp pilus assembly protein TadG